MSRQFHPTFLRCVGLVVCLVLSAMPLMADNKPVDAPTTPEPQGVVDFHGEALPLYRMQDALPPRPVPPVYPKRARDQGVTGQVTVLVKVDQKGKPAEVSIQHGHADSSLNEAAVKCVRQWRFQRMQRNGEPTAYLMLVPIVFNIAENRLPPNGQLF